MMAVLSITMFVGITLLAHAYHIVPNEHRDGRLADRARRRSAAAAGRTTRSRPATMLILVLAANTAYADFPRLASILARDRFLPRQFMNQGDRLAFSNGIVVLSVFAARAARRLRRRHARADPALHDRRVRLVHAVAGGHGASTGAGCAEPGWRTSAVDQRLRRARHRRSCSSIVATTKAAEGAWIIILLIPVLVVIFRDHAPALRSASRRSCRCSDWRPQPQAPNIVLVPIGGMQRAVVEALRLRAARCRTTCARSTSSIDPAATERVRKRVGAVGRGRAARRARLAVPVADGAAARVHRAAAARAIRTATSRSSCRSSCRTAVAAPAAQPARAADQGRAALQAEHRRHERAVSPGPAGPAHERRSPAKTLAHAAQRAPADILRGA